MNIYIKLQKIQAELKAPKSKRNNFGKYNYRSLEDIMEALKPLLQKYACLCRMDDEITMIGDRFYVRSTIHLIDTESDQAINATAYAREALTKKGMDESQITGTASSYARKYACNGLFLIDDTQDADTDGYQNVQNAAKKRPAKKPAPKFDPLKYEPLIKLVREITGCDINDYSLHLKTKWSMDRWGLKETKRFIEKVKSNEIIEPFV